MRETEGPGRLKGREEEKGIEIWRKGEREIEGEEGRRGE